VVGFNAEDVFAARKLRKLGSRNVGDGPFALR